MSNRLLAGRYELIEKIGDGGMAVVYKGKDRLLNRYVAIKILRPEYTKDEQFIENFRRESQAAAGLSHPNIVGVYDVGREGNIHYIVMELLEGEPLSEVIKQKGRIDYKEAMNITRQVASALSLAHKNQIVHRDVKPHNIMITSTGVAKLADFGIAKAVSAATIVGGDNKVIGSVHYFSPEQARGAYVDERSDLYSLGIVLYEMLTGKVPFDGDNPVSIALMHINDAIPPMDREALGIPPQLERIINKATEKYQSNRYKSADEMIAALDDIAFISKVMGQQALMDRGSSVRSEEEPEIQVEERERERFKKAVEKPAPAPKSKALDTLKNADKMNLAIIAAVVVVAIAGLIGLGYMLGWFDNSKEVEVPEFIGHTFEEAQQMAEEAGLKLERGEDVFSPDQEAGYITSQTPSKGAKVVEGKVITVAVSKGKKDNVVPKLIGKDYNEAKEYVKQFGFTITMAVKESSPLPENTIISQSVKEGTTAPQGTEIEVTISDGKGKEKVKAPKLIGTTPEEAKTILSALGLSTEGTVTYEEVSDMAENLVFWQSVEPGTEIEVGSTINIKVTKGTPPDEGEDEPSDDETNTDEGQ